MDIKEISNFEKYSTIYMNFSVDNGKLWGLPEGDKSQRYINNERLEKYETFLNSAIEYHEKMERFYKMNHDFDGMKKLKKYKTYKKRLETAKKKIGKGA